MYLASFAGLLSVLLLLVVYLADRWEREPIELIQNYYLTGLLGQLVLVLAVEVAVGSVSWSGSWILITAALAAGYLVVHLRSQQELDEPFDGIVYAVALTGGATCVIHLHNLPRVIAASPYHEALASGAVPDLRDMLIFATWPGFAAEIGQGFVMLVAAVVVGAVIGSFQLQGRSFRQIAPAGLAGALAIPGIDLLTGGVWPVRAVLGVVAVATAVIVKRGSAFKVRPEPNEGDLVVAAVKTVMMVFGAALLVTVLLQAAAEHWETFPPNDRSTLRPSAAETLEPSP